MKTYILYNPKAGSGQCESIICRDPQLEVPNRLLIDITTLSDYRDFFCGVMAEDIVILCGGDGTLHHFVNGIHNIPVSGKLYYYAAGSGNDFLRDVNDTQGNRLVPLREYLKGLPSVTVKGRTYRFINNVGFGIDGYCTLVGDAMRDSGKKNVNYTAIAIRGLLGKFSPVNAEIFVDGEHASYRDVWLCPTMFGRYYGGGMMPTPKQDRTVPGGVVSLMIFHCPSRLQTLAVFPSIFKGEHIAHTKMVNIYTGHHIRVVFDRPAPMQIDGETIPSVREYEINTAE